MEEDGLQVGGGQKAVSRLWTSLLGPWDRLKGILSHRETELYLDDEIVLSLDQGCLDATAAVLHRKRKDGQESS